MDVAAGSQGGSSTTCRPEPPLPLCRYTLCAPQGVAGELGCRLDLADVVWPVFFRGRASSVTFVSRCRDSLVTPHGIALELVSLDLPIGPVWTSEISPEALREPSMAESVMMHG